jgi:hypothetical protein
MLGDEMRVMMEGLCQCTCRVGRVGTNVGDYVTKTWWIQGEKVEGLCGAVLQDEERGCRMRVMSEAVYLEARTERVIQVEVAGGAQQGQGSYAQAAKGGVHVAYVVPRRDGQPRAADALEEMQQERMDAQGGEDGRAGKRPAEESEDAPQAKQSLAEPPTSTGEAVGAERRGKRSAGDCEDEPGAKQSLVEFADDVGPSGVEWVLLGVETVTLSGGQKKKVDILGREDDAMCGNCRQWVARGQGGAQKVAVHAATCGGQVEGRPFTLCYRAEDAAGRARWPEVHLGPQGPPAGRSTLGDL